MTVSRPVATPLVSFLVPIVSGPGQLCALRPCFESLADQTLNDFEICITIDGQVDRSIERLLPEISDRVHIHRHPAPMGRAASLHDSLRLASGRLVAPLGLFDQLAPKTVQVLDYEFAWEDDIDLAFTDEDEIDADQRRRPFYKPGFSRDRFRQQMYLGSLLVCRRSLAIEIGGFANTIVGAEEHDFALRASEQARRIVHIPQVLYHRSARVTKLQSHTEARLELGHATEQDQNSISLVDPVGRSSTSAQVEVVQAHLKRTGFPARPVQNRYDPSVIDLEPLDSGRTTVSIVIPTGGVLGPVRGLDVRLVTNAIKSVDTKSTHSDFEFVVVLDNSSTEEIANEIIDAARNRPLVLVHDTRDFNFSRACNLGAVRANGEVLIFLNDDTEVRTPGWIERLTMYATRDDIGAVGAKLLYDDDRIQQVGIWSRHGHPLHRYVGYRHDHTGNRGNLLTAQNCLAVTAACLAVEKEKFMAVGGFTPRFPLSYNDVDLCLKLARSGFRTVVDGATTMYHFESMSRDPFSSDAELAEMHRRWEYVLRADPYDNPNHRTEGVEELPLPSDSVFQFYDETESNYLGRLWPPSSRLLQG